MRLKRFVGISLALLMLFGTSVPVCAKEVFDLPSNSSFKSYMDYGTITNTSSKQYAIQQNCQTDDNGLRTYKGYYTVAVGSGFGATVGDYIDFELSTGVMLHCIIGDMKQDKHTDATNLQVAHNGNVIEFIVETRALNSDARESGDISDIAGFEGYVVHAYVNGTANIEKAEESIQIKTPNRANYLIMAKSEIPVATGETLYSLDYAFGDTFNSIVCSQAFYDSVNVGDVIDYLE